MASELCMNCFSVKGQYEVCPFCGYVEGTPPEQPHYLMPGTILGNHFIVGTVIGFGGFGITYKCFDTTLGIIVAVKEFYPVGLVNRSPGESKVGLLSGDRQQQYRAQLGRFLMEARSIAQFGKAKDIVNVYDFFEANNTAYIIMEYIDGVLLKDYLDKQGRMEPDLAMNVITPIIESVKKIHAKGIVHRDVSPDNIFISGEDTIKIFDFGAAQLNDSPEGMSGEKVIKVGYSAPEQYRDKSRQGFFTDIYSVGAIFYQMVTGIKPMESTEREFKDTLKSPAELGVNIEPNMDRAIMEAMAVQTELRIQSIQQLDDSLHAKRIAEYPKEKLKKRKRRRNWIISLSASLVLLVGVVLGLFSTVLKPESVIFDSPLGKDEIEIWVSSKEDKTLLERIADKNFHPDKVQGASERVKEMLENNKNIEVKVVNIREQNKNATMEGSLEEAKKSGKMPDMFYSSDIQHLDKFNLVSLKDNVYEELDPDEYLFMKVYPQYFPDMTEMPTGIDTVLLYAKKMKRDKTSIFYSENSDNTVELSELEKKSANEYMFIQEPNATLMSILKNNSCFNTSEGELVPDTELVNNLSNYLIEWRRKGKDPEKIYYPSGESYQDGLSTIAGVVYRQRLNTQNASGETSVPGNKNEMQDYSVSVVTNNDKMLVTYKNRYAISAESDENKQRACMRFLWVMLGEAAQTNYYKNDSPMPFPINKNVFDKFFEFNPKFTVFKNKLGTMDCEMIGQGLSGIESFEEGLRKEDKNSSEEIKKYCSEYSKK